ncbi:hypothetical protein D920_00953 [Enterococcus faecalis 13-SD-W-01]|nr:hypothetical protein D920_00953 [Enterococcus faecalis 13-SD-W-01]
MKMETLIFGQPESVKSLLKTEQEFVRSDGKTTFSVGSMYNAFDYVRDYAAVIGDTIASKIDKFTSVDGFENLRDLDTYNRILGFHFPLMYDYYKVINQVNSPLKKALKDIPREKLSDVALLTSKSSENPLIDSFQQMGIEIIKNKKDAELLVVLDGLDMDKEANRVDDSNATYYSALYHICKDWGSLKGKVQFFEKNQLVQAPWDKNPELWKQPKRTLETQKDSLNCQTSSLKTLEGLKKNAASQNINIKKQVPKKEKSTEISHSR